MAVKCWPSSIQTVVRRYNIGNTCDKLKGLTRGKGGINHDSLRAFIQTLYIPAAEKQRLSELGPETYTVKAGEENLSIGSTQQKARDAGFLLDLL